MFGKSSFGKAGFGKTTESEEQTPPPVEQAVCDWETLQRLTGKKKKRKPIAAPVIDPPEVALSPPPQPKPAPRSRPGARRLPSEEREIKQLMEWIALDYPPGSKLVFKRTGRDVFDITVTPPKPPKPPKPICRPRGGHRLAAFRSKMREQIWDFATKED